MCSTPPIPLSYIQCTWYIFRQIYLLGYSFCYHQFVFPASKLSNMHLSALMGVGTAPECGYPGRTRTHCPDSHWHCWILEWACSTDPDPASLNDSSRITGLPPFLLFWLLLPATPWLIIDLGNRQTVFTHQISIFTERLLSLITQPCHSSMDLVVSSQKLKEWALSSLSLDLMEADVYWVIVIGSLQEATSGRLWRWGGHSALDTLWPCLLSCMFIGFMRLGGLVTTLNLSFHTCKWGISSTGSQTHMKVFYYMN